MHKHSNGGPSSSDWVDYKGMLALKSYHSEFHHITDAAFLYKQAGGFFPPACSNFKRMNLYYFLTFAFTFLPSLYSKMYILPGRTLFTFLPLSV